MRIMHRIIGTNVMLKEMGVTNNNKCSFCLIAKDTIQHIFLECKHSQQLWTRILVLLKQKCTSCFRLRLSECLILFGTDDDIKTENGFELILLLAKQYLYKCKIEKQLPNIHIFNLPTSDNRSTPKICFFLIFIVFERLTVKCRFVAWRRELPQKCAYCVSVS